MVQLLLDMLSPGPVSAVEQMNRIHRTPTEKRLATKLPTVDAIERKIMRTLSEAQSLTQTQVSKIFHRHLPKKLLKKALSNLERQHLIVSTEEKTGGAPRRMWFVASHRAGQMTA